MQVCVPPVPCRGTGWRTSQDGAVLGDRPPVAMDKGTCTYMYLYSAVTIAHPPLADFFTAIEDIHVVYQASHISPSRKVREGLA